MEIKTMSPSLRKAFTDEPPEARLIHTSSLAQAITLLRKIAEMSRADLAAAVGKSESYIRQLENENSPNNSSINLLADLAKALRVDETFLVFLTMDKSEMSDAKKGLYTSLVKLYINDLEEEEKSRHFSEKLHMQITKVIGAG